MYRLNFHPSVVLILLVVFSGSFITNKSSQCDALRLRPDGGYDIVMGVEQNTPEPVNDNNYLNEIRAGIESFSNELWIASKGKFFINSADLILPGTWWTFNNHPDATWQSLGESSIRITHDIPLPNVVNPNTCGSSGRYIELPDNFFRPGRDAHYGPIGKALANLWARYRFGVWEEHGIPGNAKFPYFYTPPSFEPKWEATGCSNDEIKGDIRTIDGEIADRCDPSRAEGPADDCRFFPSTTNTANSSLLYLHWIESVTQFCDTKSHNHAAPNRQNLFCGHKSAWEVIRNSDDFLSTTSSVETPPRPVFRYIKDSKSPELYILLDRGSTVTSENVLLEVMSTVHSFLGTPSIERINVAIGSYPNSDLGAKNPYVKEEIGWAQIYNVRPELQRVLSEAVNPNGPIFRDFGLAIQEVAEKVKLRNHYPGSVILVIKRGAGANSFDKLTYENEVISSIKEQSAIKVFTIEIPQEAQTPYTNLQSLTLATSGKYHLVNNTADIAENMQSFLGDLQEILDQPSIMNSISNWVIQKQYTRPNERIEIPIYDDVSLVRVHLMTSRQLQSTEVQLVDLSGEQQSPQAIETGEWDENSDLSRRRVFTFDIKNPRQGSVWSIEHGCPTENAGEYRFFLLVKVENDRPSPRDTLTFSSKSIDIDVSTSAENNYLDMSNFGLNTVPFAIHAKIEMNQQRVLGLENVTALIRIVGDSSISWSVPLADDGLGIPDVSDNDGIYSGVFTPLRDGRYQISVAASGISGDGNSQVQIVNHAGSLIPRDQVNFGCENSTKPRCLAAVPPGSFSRVQNLGGTVAVENTASFTPGKPMKILDFKVTTEPNYRITFSFTSPRLLGSEESPDEFRFYMAPHIDNFLESTELTKFIMANVGFPSGTKVSFPFDAVRSAIPYYAVEAVFQGQKSGLSNVVGVLITEDGKLPFPTKNSTTKRLSTYKTYKGRSS